MAFTYFFRDFQTLQLIAKLFCSHYRWSCISTRLGCRLRFGQEPYTLAIILGRNHGTILVSQPEDPGNRY